jgi:heterodisulfide reductase subunit A
MAERAARGEPGTDRVGVAVCECGGDIMRRVDLGALVKGIKSNPLVTDVIRLNYPCSRTGLAQIGEMIKKHGISRVVIAGCSERIFGRLFRSALLEFGVDPSFVGFANIKEGMAAGGAAAKKAGTARALSLTRMAVASITRALKIEDLETEIKPLCLVIGAGVAGMAAAEALATRGVRVVLVEKEKSPGGLLNSLNTVFPSYMAAGEFVKARLGEIDGDLVEIVTGGEPESVTGHVGNYQVTLKGGRKIEAGAIVVATGGAVLSPEGLFGYGQNKGVVTQMEFEQLLHGDRQPGEKIVMIQCAGSRNPERPYCSRICCTASIKNTILFKEKYPGADVTILSRGFAEYAGDLDRARDMGVEIIRYALERPPEVGEKSVEVFDTISEMETTIPCDLVVLAVPIVPSDSTKDLARKLRLPTDKYGFVVEPQPKLRPGEFVPRGIYVAGCAHWPATITEAIVQGYSAGTRAFDLISSGRVAKSGFVAEMNEELCRGCGRCFEVCMHGAIELHEVEDGMKQASHMPIQCTGCGVCVSVCPSGAMSLKYATRRQVSSAIEAIA